MAERQRVVLSLQCNVRTPARRRAAGWCVNARGLASRSHKKQVISQVQLVNRCVPRLSMHCVAHVQVSPCSSAGGTIPSYPVRGTPAQRNVTRSTAPSPRRAEARFPHESGSRYRGRSAPPTRPSASNNAPDPEKPGPPLAPGQPSALPPSSQRIFHPQAEAAPNQAPNSTSRRIFRGFRSLHTASQPHQVPRTHSWSKIALAGAPPPSSSSSEAYPRSLSRNRRLWILRLFPPVASSPPPGSRR